jgi:hypothetical protein
MIEAAGWVGGGLLNDGGPEFIVAVLADARRGIRLCDCIGLSWILCMEVADEAW